jgi:hypothetical protein
MRRPDLVLGAGPAEKAAIDAQISQIRAATEQAEQEKGRLTRQAAAAEALGVTLSTQLRLLANARLEAQDALAKQK